MAAPVTHLRFSGQQTLSIDVVDEGALLRVLTEVRRRGHAITRVDFAAGDRHRPARLELGLRAGRADATRLALQLERLVDVRSVTSRAP